MAIDAGISQGSLVRKPDSDASKRTRLSQHFLKLSNSLTQREEVLIYNRALTWLRSCTTVIAALGRQR